MNPNEIQALLVALEPIMAALAAIGNPGLLGLILSAPALVIVVMLIMAHISAARMEKAHQRFAENMATMLEAYRSDTQNILREVGDKHEEVARFYRNNVELVRNYERMTDALQTLVVNNTRAVERLITIVETRHKQ